MLELGTQSPVFLPLGHARHREVHICRGYGERTGRLFGRVLARAVSVRHVRTSVEGAPVCELRGCLLGLGTQSLVFLPPGHARHFQVHLCWGYGARTGRVLGRASARTVSVRPVRASVEDAAVCELTGCLLGMLV